MSYADEDDGVPAIRGWITKQGGSHKSWKKRWIQTTPRNPFRLDYYTNDSCSNLKGHIDMSGVTDMITTRSKDKDGEMRYGFQLVTEKRTWKLIVEGEQEGEYFREAFRKLINQVRKSKGLPPLEKKKKKKHHHSSKKKDKKKEEKKSSSTVPPPAVPAAPAAFAAAPVKAGTGVAAVAAPPPPKMRSGTAIAAAAPPTAIKSAAPPPPPSTVQLARDEDDSEEGSEEFENNEEFNENEYNEEYNEEEEYDGEEEDDDIDESEIFDVDIRECEDGEKYAVALHQYDSTTDTELSIQRGQKLIIFDDSDPDGWLGAEMKDGTRGWVSAHFVKFL